jgi:hypothetical protein
LMILDGGTIFFLTLPLPSASNKLPHSREGRFSEAQQHGGTHVALVPVLKFFFRLDTSSARICSGKRTLKTSAMFLPQPTGVHHFCCCRCQCGQDNPPPHQSSNHSIAPFPTTLQDTAPASSTGNTFLPFISQISDPCDFHGSYPTNFDSMASKDVEQGGGPRLTTKAGVGASPHHPTTARPTPMSTWAPSCSQSQSSPSGHLAKESPKPSIQILEALHSKATNITKMTPDLFAHVVARPPSPNTSIPAPAESTPAELAIPSATSVLTIAVKKHQSNILSLLMSVAPELGR